ncbi:MAG: arylesterase [Pseudomonadota bacterium]
MNFLPGRVVSRAYGAFRRARKLAFALILAGTPIAAEPVTIAALGDSLTQGFGLAPDQGFVPQLGGWLEEQGIEAELINAGVSGDTTAGGLARVDWTLTPEVDAMIVALGGNDLLRGIEPSVSRANLRGILEAAGARDLPVLLVGLEAPNNYGAEFKQAFEAMYPELAAEFGTLVYPDFLAPLRAEAEDPAALQRFMQTDGIHPSAEGVARIVDGIGPSVAALAGAAGD